MALWQYNFYIIPKIQSFDKDNIKKSFGNDFFDESAFWKISKHSKIQFELISEILPLGKTWSDTLIVYGDLESHCFLVYTMQDIVESISFRINFLIDYDDMLSKIILFCEANNLLIIDPNNQDITMDYQKINNLINESIQKRKLILLSSEFNNN